MRRSPRTALTLVVVLAMVTATTPVLAADPIVLDPIGNKEATVGELLAFAVTASGGSNLGFIFESPPPSGVELGQEDGVFTWTPAPDQVGVHTMDIVAIDFDDFSNFDAEQIDITVYPAGSGDTTPPDVTINTPPDLAIYTLGEVVLADYSCTDSESGMASCVGDVPNGQPIDAASAGGPHTFTVIGTDNAGNQTTVTHSYAVEVPSGPVVINVTETVRVGDLSSVIPAVVIAITESVAVSDDPTVTPEAAPVHISISETILVADNPVLHPSILISVSEAVAVYDTDQVSPEPLPSIGGEKWEDVDGDALKDAGEPPLEGVVIYLDVDNNGSLDGGEPWTTTDSSGQYLFTEIAPGDWVVREVVADDYVQTYPDPSVDPAHRVTVISTDVSGLDFGNQPVPDLPPTIAPLPDLTADVGVPITVRPHVIDPEGDPFVLRWDGVPSTAVTNGIFEWTPDVADAGTSYDITVTAVQADKPENSASLAFRITVVEPNQPPTIEPIDDVFALPGDQFIVAPAFSDPEGDPLTHTWSGAPPNAVTNGIFILTPTAEQAGEVYEVTLTVTEDTSVGQSTFVTFHVFVGGAPNFPAGAPSVDPMVPAPGGRVRVSGSGYRRGSKAGMYILSEPVFLGTAEVDNTGAFSAFVELPADLPDGIHQIVVMGVDPSGQPRTLALEIEVATFDADNDGLDDREEGLTGTDPLNADTDEDGVIDGLDASWLIGFLDGLSRDDFRLRSHKVLMKRTVAGAAAAVRLGNGDLALSLTRLLHERVDGCGTDPDGDDWIVDCSAQVTFRQLLGLYERGITTLPLPESWW